MNAETLLHRSGRTGRAGRKGTCVVISPTHRKRVALSILRAAKVDAQMLAPPTAAEIDARYIETVLSSLLSDAITEEEAPNVSSLLAKWSPRHSPRLTCASRCRTAPSPRTSMSRSSMNPANPARARLLPVAPRFKVNLGRKQRAEPRWLLPMICKAGGVTKGAIGSIRIFDTEKPFSKSPPTRSTASCVASEPTAPAKRASTSTPSRAPASARPQSKRRPPGPPEKVRSDEAAPRKRPTARSAMVSRSQMTSRLSWRPCGPREAKAPKPYAAKEKSFPKDKGKPKWARRSRGTPCQEG